jgi:uncharacterized protein (UPF0303 family)
MAANDDIERIRKLEATLVFDRFDEAVAFEIGSAIRQRALEENLPVVVDIRSFDRPLFYAAMPGSNGSNPDWARRKTNVVRRFLKSTYRMVLEMQRPDRTFRPGDGLDSADYVLAGGGFPVTLKNAGVVGVIAVSGLPERDDHGVIVAALCDYLGKDAKALALPSEN